MAEWLSGGTRAEGETAMIVRSFGTLSVALVVAAIGVAAWQPSQPSGKGTPAAQTSGSGWQLPPDAAETKNPLTVDAKLLATGKSIFKEKCQKCHGAAGRGDGPDADPDADNMDLTEAKRAERNADGVVFFKVWNGRKKPKMPAQKEELTKEQVWAVVAHVQTLRKKPTTP
jgi:mono/diheme cytochrome c family protein